MVNPDRNLRSTTVAVARLDAATRDAMWQLFECYYVQVTRQQFDHDLAEKSHVVLLRDRGSCQLRGFSTLQLLQRRVQGRPVVVIFSGDTIVARECWGQTRLQRAFLSYVMRAKLAHPWTPVYWLLISKGYKTYLLLTRNFPEHWPRHDRPTPSWQSALLDDVARHKYGAAWLPERGILHFDHCAGALREQVAPISDEQLKFPDIRFFNERNPDHAAGDELCCLGRVNHRLWTYYMTKLARRALGLGAQRTPAGEAR